MNAFVGPKVRRLRRPPRSDSCATRLGADLHVMGSNGGVATAAMVAERPVLTLLSGPAAGVLGGAWAGALSGRRQPDHLRCRRHLGRYRHRHRRPFRRGDRARHLDRRLSDLVPMIDIHTIGAGGGSIAYRRQRRRLPRRAASAGAVPGPAAYGRGGVGADRDRRQCRARTPRSRQLPGRGMQLDVAAARAVIGELAERLGLSLEEAARRHPDRRQRQHGERDQLAHRAEGHRSARLRARRVRRRRPVAWRGGGARNSAFRRLSSRPIPASPRPSGC